MMKKLLIACVFGMLFSGVVLADDSDAADYTGPTTEETSSDNQDKESGDGSDNDANADKNAKPSAQQNPDAQPSSKHTIVFCLQTCTADYCKQSEENYQNCKNQCRGRFEGLIRGCRKAGAEANFKDEAVNEDVKFTPCPPVSTTESSAASAHLNAMPSGKDATAPSNGNEGDKDDGDKAASSDAGENNENDAASDADKSGDVPEESPDGDESSNDGSDA